MTLRVHPFFRSLLAHTVAVVCGLALLGSVSPPMKASTVSYTLIDLGSLGCCNYWIWESAATGLNNAGEVVGVTTSPVDPSLTLPFIYSNGVMTAMTDWTGGATAINENGQATGYAAPPGEIMPHLFIYEAGVFTDLGALPGYSNQPYAAGYAINNLGTIVGDSRSGAFIYENGVIRTLKRLSARYANGVNDSGDVIGLLETVKPGSPHTDKGFLFSGNQLTELPPMDGDPESQTMPAAINNRGQIVGTAGMATTHTARAFLLENGVFRDLVIPGEYSSAVDINERGDILGYSDLSPIVYRDGQIIDLNQSIERNGSIWPKIQNVQAINDLGQVVGSAYIEDADGVVHLRACLLTPIGPPQ